MSRNEYPVIVTIETTHVVWVEAADAQQAAARVEDEPSRYVDDYETLAGYAASVHEIRDQWDVETVYDGDFDMPYQGISHEDHIDSDRRHKLGLARKACADAGHPTAVRHEWLDKLCCPVCLVLLPLPIGVTAS